MERAVKIIGLLLLCGCSAGPDLSDRISPAAKNALFQPFLNADQLAGLGRGSEIIRPTVAGVAVLRARAARLRGPVLTPREGRILRAAIAENQR